MRQVLMNLLIKRSSNLLFHETKRFAGHSKWANIKHDKAVTDQKRADLFRKLGMRMRATIRESGGINDPSLNLPLAQLIEQAKKANMPAATIKRALEEKESSSNKFVIEVKALSNVLMLVHMDFPSVSQARQSLQPTIKKLGGKVIGDYSIITHFEGTHTIICKRECTLEQATEDAIKADIEHVEEVEKDGEKYFEFTCDPTYAPKCEKLLLDMDYDILFSDLTYYPRRPIAIDDATTEAIEKLRKRIMNHPGVKRIEDNIEISE